ncbi:phosphotransferase [Variovorax ureilyticus]|uniref:Phosphotransferase n=1 Tax=Variovorax ureilyticus TaxID=1836198 RepID=A0ABU8VLV9_9BURK
MSSADEVHLTRLSGGQSNPTFIVDDGPQRFVLRRKPPGTLVASAHAIDREYRVMQALQGTDVPVPRMLAYCEDASLLGTPFYLMEFLEGRVLVDQSLPGMALADRAAVYDDLNRVIAALHALDYRSVGMEGFGKPGNYFGRQIARWSRQILESTVPVPDALRRLMDWLSAHLPADDDETTLIHGDYRLDNVILHNTEPRIIGVLDWELSTLGHPLADFAYHGMSWRIDPKLWRGVGGLDLQALGIPSEQEYLTRYASRTGRDPFRHWEFYLAFNLFRMASILHGISQRAAAGNANSADAVETGRKAGPLAELGWACAMRYVTN